MEARIMSQQGQQRSTFFTLLPGYGSTKSTHSFRSVDLLTNPPLTLKGVLATAPDPVRCSACLHATPANPSDPWSWHLCRVNAYRATGWGMAERCCNQWEAAL